MRPVPFTLRAEVFQNVAVGDQEICVLYCDRLRQDVWIFDRRIHVQMAEITPVETLLKVQRLAARKSGAIHPALVIEARRIHHQRIAFPFARRVPHP